MKECGDTGTKRKVHEARAWESDSYVEKDIENIIGGSCQRGCPWLFLVLIPLS